MSIIFIFFILLIVWLLYKSLIKPYLLYRHYINEAKRLGLKVFAHAFIPFGNKVMMQTTKKPNHSSDIKDSTLIFKKGYLGYDIAVMNVGNLIYLQFITPQLMKQFYNKQSSKSYPKDEKFLYYLKKMFAKGITMSEGDVWKDNRKIITSTLNFQFIKSLYPKICSITKMKMQKIPKNQKDNKFEIYVLQILEQIFSEIIIQSFFGGRKNNQGSLKIKDQDLANFVSNLFKDLGKQMLSPFALIFGQKAMTLGLRKSDRNLNQKIKLFKQAVRNFVKQRIYQIEQQKNNNKKVQSSKFEDLIQKFYHSVNEDQRDQAFIQRIIDNFATLLIAGSDTSAHCCMMAIYYIIKNKQVHKRMISEIKEFIKSDQDLTYDCIKKMTYLECIFLEALRIYSPVGNILTRTAEQDINIGGIHVKKGTLLSPNYLSVHHDPQVYNEKDPYEFYPERWLKKEQNSEKYTVKAPSAYTWMTFSAGMRSCIGKVLVQNEIKLILIMFFKDYELTMSDQTLLLYSTIFAIQPQKIMTRFSPIK